MRVRRVSEGMAEGRAGRRRRYVTAAVFAVLSAGSSTARAGEPSLHRVQIAQADIRTFNVPAQPLASALTAFGQQAGLQVTFDSAIATNLRSTPISGSLTVDAALHELLAGTRVTYRYLDAHTVTFATGRAGEDGAMALPPVTVQGTNAQETAYGPGAGFVAHRSLTATKSDTPLIETPQSISVITRDQMDVQGVQHSVAQALRYTPGVTPEPRGDVDRYEFLYSRGFQLDQYLDGMKLLSGNFAIDQVDPYFLQRVEVLRGPASVLYGQAAPGGIANLVSKRPTDQPWHEVELQTGSYGRLQGAFDLGGPIDKDGHVLYRITGLGLTTDTQVDYTKNQRLAIAPALTWKPNPDTTITLLTNYQRDPRGGFLDIGLPSQGTVLPNPNGKISTSLFTGDPSFSRFDRTQYSIGYLLEHRLNHVWTLRQNFRYNHVDADYYDLFDRGLTANQTSINRGTIYSIEHLDAFTLDNQAQAKFDTGPLRHTLIMGIDYQHMLWTQKEGAGAGPPLNLFNPVYYQTIAMPPVVLHNRQTLNQEGIYAQDQIRWGHWAFQFGGRYDWAGLDTDNLLKSTTTGGFARAFTGRAGLVYLFDNGLAPYFSYSQSFQPQTGTSASGSAFQPTRGTQYELGVKYQPSGFNSFIMASIFNLTQDNVLTADPNHPGFSVQTGQVRSRGIELSAVASLSSDLNLTFAYTHLDNVVTKDNSGLVGKHPYYIPADTASVWADYTVHAGPASGLGFGGGIRYVGASWGNSANTLKVPAYALFDAVVHYDLGSASEKLAGYQVALNASNLFDKQYVSGCSSANGCFYGLRRTILATLRYRW